MRTWTTWPVPDMTPPCDASGQASFWSAATYRNRLDPADLRRGLVSVEVVCPAPRYVTLHVVFCDETLARLLVPLEPHGSLRYRKIFSLVADARDAWLEVMPHGMSDGPLSVRVKPAGTAEVMALAWRAAKRHARSPSALLAKVRQVVRGGASLVFSSAVVGREVADKASYCNWQQAFEGKPEAQRVRAALERQFGPRRVRVLAVITGWRHGGDALAAQLASLAAAPTAEVRVLDLAATYQKELNATPPGVASWHQIPSDNANSVPLATIGRAAQESVADLVLFLERPGRFHPLAIPSLMLELVLAPAAHAAYADHDQLDATGHRHTPLFKPTWSPDYLTACDYVIQPVVFRGCSSVFSADIDIVSPLCPSFSILMNLACRGTATDVRHVPRVLFHVAEDGPGEAKAERWAAERTVVEALSGTCVQASPAVDGAEAPLRRVRHCSADMTPSVSVVIPSKDNSELLARACKAVTTAAGVRATAVLVDNGSTSDEQRRVLAKLARDPRVRIVSCPGPFNFSHLINAGCAHCESDVLLLLNDDVEALDTVWLAELVGHAARPDIGAVGALLLYPDNRVQHAGVVLGINGGAGHAFRFAAADDDGVGYRLRVVHEVSAVTAACLAVRKSIFDEVGGFDEDLPVTLNDVDFCLKLRARGYRNLFTPHARLIHRESTSRGLDITPERLRRLSRETAIFRRCWGEAALIDPFYSPHLSLSHEDFRPRML